SVEDVVVSRRSFVALDVGAHESEGAVKGVDSTFLAHHGAVGLVAVDRAIGRVHRAGKGIDPAAVGIHSVGLVGADGAARERQNAVFTVDPAAQRGARGVDLVAVDHRIGDRRGATETGRADATTRRRRHVVVDGAGGDAQRALVASAAAG